MTVSDEVRAAKKTRQFHSARDFETSASQIGDIEPFADDMKTKAQRIIAANAIGDGIAAQAADAALLMRMLGIHPDDKFDPTLATTVAPAPTRTQ